MQELLKQMSVRELRLMLLGVGAVITTAMIVTLLLPGTKSLRVVQSQIRVLEAAAEDGAELDRRLHEQHEQIEELRYRIHGDMANLPVRQVEAYIIGRLQSISWNNDVELVSVVPATGDRVQVFQEMLFNVELLGEYDDLYRWLIQARTDLGYVVVKEYAVRRNDENDERPILAADLSLASYRTVR